MARTIRDGNNHDLLLESLAKIYPQDRLFTRAEDLARYKKDLVSREMVLPLAAVMPSYKEQVIETVRLCHNLNVPFVARGAGSSLSGGALPVADGIVIHLRDLNRILRLVPEERIAVVEPGVINLDVTTAAQQYNLHYAPDPSSQGFCTIGGSVAFNSGGLHCLKYGMTSNHILGIEAVLADGEVVKLGGESLEGAGPDLQGIFVGSEGLFGVALEITLRLIPQVEKYYTVLAAYRSLEEAGDVVSSVIASGLLPGALEIMDPLAIRVTEAASHAGYPLDAGALVIIELEGEERVVEEDFADLLRIVENSGAYKTRTATDKNERAAIWKGRKAAFTAIRKVSANYIIQDGVVPRGRLGQALAEIEKLSRRFNIPIANVFHAGDGNLHPLILYEADGCDADRDKAEELAGEITRRCIEMGGSITGEHGVGLEKRKYLPEMFGPDDMGIMRRLRTAMDPKSIANPGKMLEIGCDYPVGGEKDEASISGIIEPASVEEVREAVKSYQKVLPVGGGTKPSLAEPGTESCALRMTSLRGMLNYDPNELTFTALAGTPVAEIAGEIVEHGQYLPFDPPLMRAGATIGGTVAAGLSGPGSYLYGGIRNFIIGADFVDGSGTLIRGGSKVVKNAAGFDFPKLLVGSLGGLGVLTQLTFKVFPNHRSTSTLQIEYPSLDKAVTAIGQLGMAPLSLMSIELESRLGRVLLSIRVGGNDALLKDRIGRVAALAGAGTMIEGTEETRLWESWGEFSWVKNDHFLVRVPTTLSAIIEINRIAELLGLECRYGIGGNVAWLSGPNKKKDLLSRLDLVLNERGLSGVVHRGGHGKLFIGKSTGSSFQARVKRVLTHITVFVG